MRTINWKFALALALILAGSAAGFHVLHVYQIDHNADTILALAHECRDEGQTDQAIRYAAQYLEFRPNDAAALRDLAEMMFKRATTRRQYAGVLNLYEKVLRLAPDDAVTRLRAADLAIRLYQWADALENLDLLLTAKPDDADLLVRVGYCQQMVGKHTAAADSYKKALSADPNKASTYVYYAGLLQNQFKKTDEARAILDEAIAALPDSAEAYAGRAQFLRTTGKYANAAADIRTAVALKPRDGGILLAAAEIEQLNGNWRKAREHFQEGNRLFPKNSKFLTALAWGLFYDGKPDQAIAKLREGKEANPKDIDVLILLAEVYAQDGQLAQLERTLDDLQEIKPLVTERAQAEHFARAVLYVQARLAMRRGQWPAAAEAFDKLRTLALRSPTLFRQANNLLAQCAAALNEATTELDAYRRILENDPNATTIRLEFAKSLARYGKHDDALKQFLPVIARSEAPGRWVADAARSLLTAARTDVAAFQALTRAIDSLKLDDANANPLLVKTLLNLERGRAGESLPAVENALKNSPAHVALHLARIGLLDHLYGMDRALAAVNEAEKYAGTQADFRVARARLYAARLDPSASGVLTSLGRGLERFSADDRVRILQELVLAFRSIGDAANATAHLELLAQTRPDHLIARELLAATALRTGAEERRQTALREIAAIEGNDGPTSARTEALRLVYEYTPDRTVNLTKARALLDAVLKVQRADAAAEFLLGRVEELAGNGAAALAHYQAALDLRLLDSPSEELFACVRGRTGALPVTVLRDELKLAERFSLDRHRTVLLAALPMYDEPSRVRLAETLSAKANDRDGTELANLGRLFARFGLARQAEAVFRQAARVAPQSPEGWAALIVARAKQNDADGLQALIAEVRQGLTTFDAHVLIGTALVTAGRHDDAGLEFETAAALKPDDTRPMRHLVNLFLVTGKPAETRAMLKKIIEAPSPTSGDDVHWARRNLAVSLAYTPSKAAFEQACLLLNANAVNGDLAEDDLRAFVLVLATQKGRTIAGNGGTARQEAIRILEGLAEKGTRNGDDLLMLAKLYRVENDEPKARQARDRLRTEFATHYAAVAYLARLALSEHDLDECGKLLPILRKLGPSQFETVAIEFKYQVLTGAADQGRRLLDNYIATGETPRAQLGLGLRAADLVYDFVSSNPLSSRPEAASALRAFAVRHYQPFVDQEPQAFQRIVSLLCDSHQTDQAIDTVQRYRKAHKVETIAAAQVLLLRKGQAVDSRRTESFLREALQQAPQSLPLRLTLADFCDHVGQHDEAIRLYREVLRFDPGNVAALNNLAWVLSYDRRNAARVAEALAKIQQAIDLAGPLDELLDTRARILFEAGQPESALRDLKEAICEVPSAKRYGDLVAMLRRTGRTDDAEKVLAQARQLGFDSPAIKSR